MAKARIKTPDGIAVEVEGTPTEITKVVQELRGKLATGPVSRGGERGRGGRVLLVDLVASLIDSGFFKKPRSLADIKRALEEIGHHYPVTTLSAAMLRQVRRRSLRRVREKKLWFYTQ